MDDTLRKNFSYLFLLQIANYIIPLILLPYLTHILGAENFGKISFVQAFIVYFILITDYGFNTSSTQQVVKVRENKDNLSKVFWITTFTKILFAVIGFVLLISLILTVQKLKELQSLLLIAYSGVISSILFPIWLFQGLEKMSVITWINVIQRILILICTFLFVKLRSDYQIALVIQCMGVLIASAVSALVILKIKLIHFYWPTVNNIREAVSEGWHIFISGVATNFYTTTNTVILGFLTNNTVLGFFTASEKIIRAIISLLSSINQVTFPRINTYYQESKEKALKFGKKLLKLTGSLTLIIATLIFLLAPEIVRILFGLPQFHETIEIMRISSILPFFTICNGVLAINLLITFGLKEYLFRIVGLGCLFSLLLVFPAAHWFKASGVAWVAVLTEMVISLHLIYILRKNKISLQLISS